MEELDVIIILQDDLFYLISEKVVVKVTNKMVGTVTAVHWHGQTMEGTPYMDGVASVSQCPIHPGETFTYR